TPKLMPTAKPKAFNARTGETSLTGTSSLRSLGSEHVRSGGDRNPRMVTEFSLQRRSTLHSLQL
ncbi:hypothetical protein, partial [Rhizobium sp. PDO1-076]|uniref:hypothetical protein n=1 Tax=Rhizobium sp. PDO1-076 TaxID=1125979 RepID=UPI001AEC565C